MNHIHCDESHLAPQQPQNNPLCRALVTRPVSRHGALRLNVKIELDEVFDGVTWPEDIWVGVASGTFDLVDSIQNHPNVSAVSSQRTAPTGGQTIGQNNRVVGNGGGALQRPKRMGLARVGVVGVGASAGSSSWPAAATAAGSSSQPVSVASSGGQPAAAQQPATQLLTVAGSGGQCSSQLWWPATGGGEGGARTQSEKAAPTTTIVAVHVHVVVVGAQVVAIDLARVGGLISFRIIEARGCRSCTVMGHPPGPTHR